MIQDKQGIWRFLAAFLAASVLTACALVFAGCPMEDDPLTEAPAEAAETPETPEASRPALDERLFGIWEWTLGSIVERISIRPTEGSTLGSLTYASNVYSAAVTDRFAGNIIYAENFSDTAGVIIIRYLSGKKQQWVDWDKADPEQNSFPLRQDHPVGKNFYGIYFLNLNGEGTQVFLACTNDQNNNYGPTETETLEQAKEKFTQGNMNQLLDLSVGDPQTKVQDL
jgi:hypothetical protein